MIDERELFQYRAFISYAHADVTIAAKLQRALERYALPQNLVPTGRLSSLSKSRKGFAPIFRDSTELSAHHSLADKITEALAASQYLIVLCSPAAKKSEWVAEEIRQFRALHGDAYILCALIEGTPESSFPGPLTADGREPLAAGLGKGQFRLGVTQLAASMLGVGLDALVQRDMKRLRARVTAITAGAATAMIVMGSLTWLAVDARRIAELKTGDAEGQIEFMLTDLKDKLDGVGRLDAMQIVGENAARYYDSYPLSAHDDDALARRAKVFHLIGQTQAGLGNDPDASTYFQQAHIATQDLLARDPDNAERLFGHSQSAYYVGSSHYDRADYAQAAQYFQTYLDMILALQAIEGESERVREELTFAYTNLGATALRAGDLAAAKSYYGNTRLYKQRLFEDKPDDSGRLLSLVKAFAHQAELSLNENDLSATIEFWQEGDNYLRDYMDGRGPDARLSYQRLRHARALSRLQFQIGNTAQAQVDIAAGQTLADQLLAIDPNSVDPRYEKTLLYILSFEMAYVVDDTDKLDSLQQDIAAQMAAFPDDFAATEKFLILDSVATTLPIYRAIDGDQAALRSLAQGRLRALSAAGVTSAKDAAMKSYELPALMLVDLILGNEDTAKIMSDLCTDTSLQLDFQRRAMLAVRYDHSVCENAIDTDRAQASDAINRMMMARAIQRYQVKNQIALNEDDNKNNQQK